MDVLVMGARGTLGRLVSSQLLARGHRAIALGRDDGDLRDPHVIARANARVIINCAGASVAMGLGRGWRGYRAVDVPIGLAAVEAARRTRARLIYVGVHHTAALRAGVYVDAHERVAAAMHDVDGAIVRPTGFFAAIAGAFLPMARRGFLVDVGDGQTRTNPICERDLAEIVVDVALGGDGPRDISVGGPEVMTRREMIEKVSAAAGRRARMFAIPLWLARASAFFVRGLHPRMGQFMQFVVGLAQHDVIAPALGMTKLDDYLRDYVPPPEVVGRRTAA